MPARPLPRGVSSVGAIVVGAKVPQIYEGTSQIQHVGMARQFLK